MSSYNVILSLTIHPVRLLPRLHFRWMCITGRGKEEERAREQERESKGEREREREREREESSESY